MSSLLKEFITKKKMVIGKDLPLNKIDDNYIQSDKLPWIVKKTVIVSGKSNNVETDCEASLIDMPELKDFRFIKKDDIIVPELSDECSFEGKDSNEEIQILDAEELAREDTETENLPFVEARRDEEPEYGDESNVIDLTWSSCGKIQIPGEISVNRIKYIEPGKPSTIVHAGKDAEIEYLDAIPKETADEYRVYGETENESDDYQENETDCSNSVDFEDYSTENELNENEVNEVEAIEGKLTEEKLVEKNLSNKVEEIQESRDLYEKERDRQRKEEEDKAKEKVFKDICVSDEYIIPMSFLNLSEDKNEESWQSEIRNNSRLLVKTLNDFGIESRVVKVNRGPVVTLYEIQIAPGIKVNRIVGLSDDIAMALAASRVRIVAPIPGKSAVGVEIPNKLREDVTLGDILHTPEYEKCKMELQVALGKDILGKPLMLDLKRQPHLLIAGATGAGKSVCVNTIISSLVYKYDPSVVRFIMVDPKMVELQLYNGLPHQLSPVITEPDIAPKALKWAIYEMERRYRLLSEYSTRDIERYNQKIDAHPRSYDLERLPYIVIIVDELADLMMVAPKEIENYITRIAQKARAVGIHLVLATQRPSVDVITGIIKANFPARIAFQVAQKTDSRTIIDQNGAEKLLGKGDMLYQSPMSSFPVRIQGAFVSEEEVQDIVKHARRFGKPQYIDIEEAVDEREEIESGNVEDEDELFVEALKIIEETRKASASYLQRRLSIGYNRAARIIERMEELGYVGPPQGSKPREVLV